MKTLLVRSTRSQPGRASTRLLFALALLCLICSSASAQPPATVTHNVNLRPTASTVQAPIELLSPPATVTLLSTAPKAGFYHVQAPDGRQGWVWAKNITLGGAAASPSHAAGAPPPPPPPPSSATNVAGTEAVDTPSCPAEGHNNQTGVARQDDELRNRAKRFIANATTPVVLSIADFQSLQADTDPNAANHIQRQVPRNLTNKHAGTHTVNEGERVAVTGFLHRAEEGSAAESVNCAGSDGRDIHLNINQPKPNPPTFNEWTGIVVEIIPQAPLLGWTSADHLAVLSALQAVRDAALPVLAIGSLTYDNQHQVNSDKANPRGTNPKRVSLWEVHPVLEFYVCPKNQSCDPARPTATWESLKIWRTRNPQ
jgi:hypothetical protein